jgi:hypothetical protein
VTTVDKVIIVIIAQKDRGLFPEMVLVGAREGLANTGVVKVHLCGEKTLGGRIVIK